MAKESPELPHIYTRLSPISEGELLLWEGDMEAVRDPDVWGRPRRGIITIVTAGGEGGRNCILCSQAIGGLGHTAASFARTTETRRTYLEEGSTARREELEIAGDGTWESHVFSVTAGVSDLGAGVRFGGAIGILIAKTMRTRKDEGRRSPLGGHQVDMATQ